MLTLSIGSTSIVLFALGSAIGSFLHVVAERYMNGTSPVRGHSICPHCKKRLSAYELIPIISYIVQRAHCRGCGAAIPMHYPLLELVSGVLFLLVFLPVVTASQSLVLALCIYIAACLLLILLHIDARSMMLPDIYILMLAGMSIVIAYLTGSTADQMALGALVGSGAIYAIWLATAGEGIGFGDVKLMIPLGMLFGLRGSITLLFLAFFIGGMVGIVLLAMKKAGRKTAIPFGPFLAGAALLLLIYPQISDRFFALLGV